MNLLLIGLLSSYLLLLNCGGLLQEPASEVCYLVVSDLDLIFSQISVFFRRQRLLKIITIALHIDLELVLLRLQSQTLPPEILHCLGDAGVLSEMEAKKRLCVSKCRTEAGKDL